MPYICKHQMLANFLIEIAAPLHPVKRTAFSDKKAMSLDWSLNLDESATSFLCAHLER